MQQGVEKQLRYQICCPGLPLAVYREVAAHLRQVNGVETGLYPLRSEDFDYNQSQIGGLWIQYQEHTDSADRQRVDEILAYYANRYQPWQEYQE